MMRKKLIELLNKAMLESDSNYGLPSSTQVADYLIKNGVTVLPYEQEKGQKSYRVKVMCKYCKNRKSTTFSSQDFCSKFGGYVSEDDFCSRGDIISNTNICSDKSEL